MGLIKRKKNKMEEKFNIKFILQTDRIVRKWLNLLFINHSSDEIDELIDNAKIYWITNNGYVIFDIEFVGSDIIIKGSIEERDVSIYETMVNVIITSIASILDDMYDFGKYNKMLDNYFVKKLYVEDIPNLVDTISSVAYVLIKGLMIDKLYIQGLDNCKASQISAFMVIINSYDRNISYNQILLKDEIVKSISDRMKEIINQGKVNYKVIEKKEFNERDLMLNTIIEKKNN